MQATLTRPASKPHTTPIGSGELHRALEDARDLSQLRDFCRAHVCTPEEVSSNGGKSLNILRVIDLMRRRGYAVSDPHKPQQQPRKGMTAWLIDVALPSGHRVSVGFYTPNTS